MARAASAVNDGSRPAKRFSVRLVYKSDEILHRQDLHRADCSVSRTGWVLRTSRASVLAVVNDPEAAAAMGPNMAAQSRSEARPWTMAPMMAVGTAAAQNTP